jgi:hypothetical protein
MKITSKNLAKLRRELAAGDTISYFGLGVSHDIKFTTEVLNVGNREPTGFVTIREGMTPKIVDYYRIVTWEKVK